MQNGPRRGPVSGDVQSSARQQISTWAMGFNTHMVMPLRLKLGTLCVSGRCYTCRKVTSVDLTS